MDNEPSKEIKMLGVEYAQIHPGDVSPAAMVLAENEEKKTETKDTNSRQEMLGRLKATKELRKNMKR